MAKTSKSSVRSDRQKVIDDIRRKQKSAEKRQGTIIVVVCVAIAAAIIVAAAWKPVWTWVHQKGNSTKPLTEIGAPAADVCSDITRKKANGNQQHEPTGTQIDYPDSPPAFGPHWNEPGQAPVPIHQRFYTTDNRPELEELVHNLEHGYTILWYDDTAANSPSMLADVKSIAARLDVSDTNNRYSFKAVPWTKDDGDPFPDGKHIALTAWTTDSAGDQWGEWQYCSKPSGEAVQDFMAKFPYTNAPEPIGGYQPGA